jgi:hypothetical protein
MPHFAKLDSNNIVTFVTVGSAADDGKETELFERTGDVYKQTSYNTYGNVHALGGTPFRKNFASVGFKYDEAKDAFIPPQEFPSWTLDEETCLWVPPVSKPTDGKAYTWDEAKLNWAVLNLG